MEARPHAANVQTTCAIGMCASITRPAVIDCCAREDRTDCVGRDTGAERGRKVGQPHPGRIPSSPRSNRMVTEPSRIRLCSLCSVIFWTCPTMSASILTISGSISILGMVFSFASGCCRFAGPSAVGDRRSVQFFHENFLRGQKAELQTAARLHHAGPAILLTAFDEGESALQMAHDFTQENFIRIPRQIDASARATLRDHETVARKILHDFGQMMLRYPELGCKFGSAEPLFGIAGKTHERRIVAASTGF